MVFYWKLCHSFSFSPVVQGASTFTFLSQEQDDNDSTAAEDSRIESAEEIKKNPWQTTSKLPYDSSGDSDDDDDDDDKMVVDDAVNAGDPAIKLSSQLDELFFFHPGDPGLTNRINGELLLLLRDVKLHIWNSIMDTPLRPLCDLLLKYRSRALRNRPHPSLPDPTCKWGKV